MTERFTVYDVFAVLVPGTVFGFLLAVTLRELAGARILDWSGGFGDATVLVIMGYASGVLLQAIGNGLGKLARRRRPRMRAIPRLLVPDSPHYSEELRREAVDALEGRYGSLPPSDHPAHSQMLEEKAFRLYKQVAATDPTVSRFLAEHHQMRAYAVGFALLAVVALMAMPVDDSPPLHVHLLVATAYALLAGLSFWRLRAKDLSLAFHVLARFLEPGQRTSE